MNRETVMIVALSLLLVLSGLEMEKNGSAAEEGRSGGVRTWALNHAAATSCGGPRRCDGLPEYDRAAAPVCDDGDVQDGC